MLGLFPFSSSFFLPLSKRFFPFWGGRRTRGSLGLPGFQWWNPGRKLTYGRGSPVAFPPTFVPPLYFSKGPRSRSHTGFVLFLSTRAPDVWHSSSVRQMARWLDWLIKNRMLPCAICCWMASHEQKKIKNHELLSGRRRQAMAAVALHAKQGSQISLCSNHMYSVTQQVRGCCQYLFTECGTDTQNNNTVACLPRNHWHYSIWEQI